MPPLRPTTRSCVLAPLVPLLLAATGCAGVPSTPGEPDDLPQVLVEVLPARAELSLDGQPVGRGGQVLTVAEPGRRYSVVASAAGFEPAERTDTGAQLAGTRIVLALRPVGTPGRGALDPDDARALASAAEALLRRGDGAAARDYTRRAAALAPDAPAVRRVVDELERGRAAAATIEVRPDPRRER